MDSPKYMTTESLRDWQKRHGFTYDSAAQALGVSRATYAKYVAGKVSLNKMLALACAAVDAGIAVEPV